MTKRLEERRNWPELTVEERKKVSGEKPAGHNTEEFTIPFHSRVSGVTSLAPKPHIRKPTRS